MNDDWIKTMFFWSVIGSLAGLLWPLAVAWFKKLSGDLYPIITRRAGPSPIMKAIALIVSGIFIAVVAAAVGFGVFLGDAENRKALQEQGLLAYFLAFNFGFGSASLIEEPLKGNRT
jgi:hypothetical protein